MMRNYVRFIDAINHKIGRIVMYGIFVLMAILFGHQYRKHSLPSLWTLEMAQFAMVAYYILGGPYSIDGGRMCGWIYFTAVEATTKMGGFSPSCS